MRYSQVVAPRTSEVATAPVRDPERDEVQVEVVACGVCASELHPWAEGQPRRLGHEPVGIVRAVGVEAERFREGDRVTGLFIEAFADICLVKEERLLPVPTGLPDESALGEPLACLVNAQRRTPVDLADRVAIVGLGYMGLGMLQLLKLRGPRQIVAIDIREDTRARALTLGADEAYHPEHLPADFRLTTFRDWQRDRGFDVVIEAAGAGPALTLAGELVRAHGVLSIVGFHQGGLREIDVGMWNWKAIDVVNAHVRRQADLLESMRIGLDLTAKGLIDLGSLVTHQYSLEDVDRAYGDLQNKAPGFVKAVVRPQAARA